MVVNTAFWFLATSFAWSPKPQRETSVRPPATLSHAESLQRMRNIQRYAAGGSLPAIMPFWLPTSNPGTNTSTGSYKSAASRLVDRATLPRVRSHRVSFLHYRIGRKKLLIRTPSRIVSANITQVAGPNGSNHWKLEAFPFFNTQFRGLVTSCIFASFSQENIYISYFSCGKISRKDGGGFSWFRMKPPLKGNNQTQQQLPVTHSIPSCWLNHPSEKWLVKLDHFPRDRGENPKHVWNHHLGIRS